MKNTIKNYIHGVVALVQKYVVIIQIDLVQKTEHI